MNTYLLDQEAAKAVTDKYERSVALLEHVHEHRATSLGKVDLYLRTVSSALQRDQEIHSEFLKCLSLCICIPVGPVVKGHDASLVFRVTGKKMSEPVFPSNGMRPRPQGSRTKAVDSNYASNV